MHKILFLCRFNATVYFVSSLLISLPRRRVIFLNSNFLDIIPFIDFASQFMCNPGGVFFWRPVYFEVGHAYQLLPEINFFKHPTSILDLSLKKLCSMAVAQHRRGSGGG